MRASNADRERVAQLLHNALSEGRITVQELEERLDTVYAAKTLKDLEPPVADLPNVSPGNAVQPAPSQSVDTRVGGVPGSAASVAIMSGASRKGNWVLPATHNSFAFWGGVDIDLRGARFAERHSTINAVAIMGGIDIIVPDDIVVDVNGIGFMGAFETEDDHGAGTIPPPGAPVVKITGFAFWGAVTVIRKPRKHPPSIGA
ncbi:DUF1707 SHOCT-like domain-containing protein [Amycolatopsis alkalitolerans]|uniref:DUF1707 domain-containing protein n=1 Tax=Amycolatopsis alkalitolerans TaxID=2547244 RepID=A0A5C4LVI1_9PSEU|nr:DUF1707 domain-containing protein [Amycolatopsis alkalitolerans]TNC21681.1 DUF1707 domain-containing protein [Amycolatopsis alkalitolerans]